MGSNQSNLTSSDRAIDTNDSGTAPTSGVKHRTFYDNTSTVNVIHGTGNITSYNYNYNNQFVSELDSRHAHPAQHVRYDPSFMQVALLMRSQRRSGLKSIASKPYRILW